jgi:hypothetical protein
VGLFGEGIITVKLTILQARIKTTKQNMKDYLKQGKKKNGTFYMNWRTPQ